MNRSATTRRQASIWKSLGLAGWAILLIGALSPVSETQVAIVDTDRVISGSAALQRMMEAAMAEAAPLRAEFEAKQVAYAAAVQQYEAQKAALSTQAAGERYEQLLSLGNEVELLEFRLGQRSNDARDMIAVQLAGAIERAAVQQGATLVLPVDAPLYFASVVDITPRVIADLDGE